MDEVPLREQVFKKASELDNEIEDLNSNLVNVQRNIDELMMKNS